MEAQEINYPKGYFIAPLDGALSLAGNFGELRNNHFHSGFDFRTNGEEGKIVLAAADGFVSRIKVSAFGYGNALYITHPNGYVTVYGHLQSYDSIITKYVRGKQYEQESFEVDLFPQKNEIKIKQGQQIALSGNTGGSEGPHLHFEIRDAKTEYIINPYFFGFDIKDDVKPSIESIMIYPLDNNATINGVNRSKELDVFEVKNKKLSTNEKLTICGNIGFAIVTTDYESKSNNKNGTYNYSLKADGEVVFDYKCTTFSFDKTRYINAHIDYQKMKKNKVRYQRCYLSPGNKIDLYRTNNQKGAVFINDTLNHEFILKACDFNANCEELSINFKGKIASTQVKKEAIAANHFSWDKSNSFKTNEVNVSLPTGCLYEDFDFKYSKSPATLGTASAIHSIHQNNVPLHVAYTLSIKPDDKALTIKDKLLLVSVDDSNRFSYEGGEFENGWVTTKTRSFGKFAVKADTTAPSVKILNTTANKDWNKTKNIKVKISDNLSGIKSYRGMIDGNWVLMEYNYKENVLTYFFDEKLKQTATEHNFTIVVTDRKMNTTKADFKFIY